MLLRSWPRSRPISQQRLGRVRKEGAGRAGSNAVGPRLSVQTRLLRLYRTTKPQVQTRAAASGPCAARAASRVAAHFIFVSRGRKTTIENSSGIPSKVAACFCES